MASSVPNPDMLQFLELVKVMLLTAQPGSSVPLPSFRSKLTCIRATDNNRSLWVGKLQNHDLSIGLATAEVPNLLTAKNPNPSQLVNIEGSLTASQPVHETEEATDESDEVEEKPPEPSDSQRFRNSLIFGRLRRLFGYLIIFLIVIFIIFLAYEGMEPFSSAEVLPVQENNWNISYEDDGETCIPIAQNKASTCSYNSCYNYYY